LFYFSVLASDFELKSESLRRWKRAMADFEAFREGVDYLVRLEVVIDEYLTAKIGILGRG
jgi:hypothetical protein